MREFRKYALFFLGSVAVGYLLLCLAYCIPTERMKRHVQEETELLHADSYPYVVEHYETARLDDFMDRLILLHVLYRGPESAFEQAAQSYRLYFGEPGEHESTEVFEALFAEEEPQWSSKNYAWYWHGYLIILKPLFFFLRYSDWRILNGLFVMLAVCAAVAGLRSMRAEPLILPFLLAVWTLNPFTISLSIQNSTAFYVTMGELLYVLWGWKPGTDQEERDQALVFSFFAAGIAMAYFDLLTYPLAAWGLPAVCAVYLLKQQGARTGRIAKLIVMGGMSFIIGFGAMLVAKWAVNMAVMRNTLVLQNARNHVSEKLTETGLEGSISRVDALARNAGVLMKPPYLAVFAVSLVILLIGCIRGERCRRRSGVQDAAALSGRLQAAGPALLIAAAPVVWYLVLANHSYVHYFFVHRELSVTVFALFAIPAMLTGDTTSCEERKEEVKV